MSAPPVVSVMSRIASIEQRFVAPTTDVPPESAALRVLDDGPAFDAFGDVYQRAVAARDAAGASPMSTWSAPAAPGGMYGASLSTPGLDPFASAPAGRAGLALGGVGAPGGVGGGPLLDAAIGGVLAPPGERRIGGYGEMPVPDAVRPYGNGRIPVGSLTPLATQPGHRLYAPAAASWNNVVAAARAEGIELRLTDSYRDYEEQVDLVRRKGLYSQGGLAATPGRSNHGWGLAVDADVTDPRTLRWLKANGPRFGWVEAVPREPWHWEFRPDQV